MVQMRKIESKAEMQKKQRKNQLIVGVILVAIMVLSTAGYSIMDRGETETGGTETYNNFKFASVAGRWGVQKQGFNLATRYLPKEVENISYQAAISANSFNGKEVYFVALSDDAKMVANEVATNLPVLRAQFACIEDDANRTECSDLPLKTCSNFVFIIDEKRFNNASSSINNSANFNTPIKPKIYQKENCITIEASSKDMMRAADRFLFGAYGII